MKINCKCALASGLVGLVSVTSMAHAATNKQLEQRLNRLSRQLQQTRNELRQSEHRSGQKRQPSIEPSSQRNKPRLNAKQKGQARFVGNANNPSRPPAQIGFHMGEHTTVTVGGYIKLDAAYSDYSSGPTSDSQREQFFDAAIPVGKGRNSKSTDFNARESRFHIASTSHFGDHVLKAYISTDTYGSKGSEVIVNSSGFRLRQAYFELDNTWLFGQTYSNFSDLKAHPEHLDFNGPEEATAVVRQPEIRYRHGGFSASLENPDNQLDVDPTGSNTLKETTAEELPAVTAKYILKTSFGHLGFAGIVKKVGDRQITDLSGNRFPSDSAVGYGARFTGRIDLGNNIGINSGGDDIRFATAYGRGIGRYFDASIPSGYINKNGITTIPFSTSYVAFHHYWTHLWRSNLIFGRLQIFNNNIRKKGQFTDKYVETFEANLIWNPYKRFLLGGEYFYGKRKETSGLDGHFNRFQFSAKYTF